MHDLNTANLRTNNIYMNLSIGTQIQFSKKNDYIYICVRNNKET